MADKIKIIAILGKSGSGKTTLADIFGQQGIPPVESHTTRTKRHKRESSHVFHTIESYSKIENKIAETVYGGKKYCGVLPESDSKIFTYVIDEIGLNMLRGDSRFDVVSVLVLATTEDRMARTTQERFERDADFVYSCYFDHIVTNNSDLEGLNNHALAIIATL